MVIMPLQIIKFGILLLLYLGFSIGFNSVGIHQFYIKTSYYIILFLFLIWSYYFFNLLIKKIITSDIKSKNIIYSLIISVLFTTVVYLSVPSRFRVLSDETNLLGVARSMTYDHSVYNQTMTKQYYDNVTVIGNELEKRPLLFPFFTQILHKVLGYNVQNAFRLNYLILFFTLFSIFSWLYQRLSIIEAISACLAIISIPIVTQNATSAGFDLFASSMTGLSFYVAYLYIKEKNNSFLNLLILQLLMLSHARYESFLIGLIILGLLLVFKYIQFSKLKYNVEILLLSPIFISPLVFQRILMPNKYENSGNVDPFSFEHFLRNFQLFIQSQFKLISILPYPFILNWLGFLSLFIFSVFYFRKQINFNDTKHRHIAIIVFISTVAQFLLYMCYYFGDYTHPSSARFFIYISIVLTLCPYILNLIRSKTVPISLLVGSSLVSFFIYHPLSMEERFPNTQFLIRETYIIYNYLNKNVSDKNQLLIYSRPGQLSVHEYGAVDFNYANSNKDNLLNELDRHLFKDIYVFQRISYETQQPLKDDQLSESYKLTTLEERQTTATEYLRISKVTK